MSSRGFPFRWHLRCPVSQGLRVLAVSRRSLRVATLPVVLPPSDLYSQPTPPACGVSGSTPDQLSNSYLTFALRLIGIFVHPLQIGAQVFFKNFLIIFHCAASSETCITPVVFFHFSSVERAIDFTRRVLVLITKGFSVEFVYRKGR